MLSNPPKLVYAKLIDKFICIMAKESTLPKQGVSCSHVVFKFNWCQSGVKPLFLAVRKA